MAGKARTSDDIVPGVVSISSASTESLPINNTKAPVGAFLIKTSDNQTYAIINSNSWNTAASKSNTTLTSSNGGAGGMVTSDMSTASLLQLMSNAGATFSQPLPAGEKSMLKVEEAESLNSTQKSPGGKEVQLMIPIQLQANTNQNLDNFRVVSPPKKLPISRFPTKFPPFSQNVSLSTVPKPVAVLPKPVVEVPRPPGSAVGPLVSPLLYDTVGTEVPSTRKPCHCTRSHCLKLYCECFQSGISCFNCNCTSCFNNEENSSQRDRTIRFFLDHNPTAFQPKINKKSHIKGCNCKKSGCLKKYCECYEAKVPCNPLCRCKLCYNTAEKCAERLLVPDVIHDTTLPRILPRVSAGLESHPSLSHDIHNISVESNPIEEAYLELQDDDDGEDTRSSDVHQPPQKRQRVSQRNATRSAVRESGPSSTTSDDKQTRSDDLADAGSSVIEEPMEQDFTEEELALMQRLKDNRFKDEDTTRDSSDCDPISPLIVKEEVTSGVKTDILRVKTEPTTDELEEIIPMTPQSVASNPDLAEIMKAFTSGSGTITLPSSGPGAIQGLQELVNAATKGLSATGTDGNVRIRIPVSVSQPKVPVTPDSAANLPTSALSNILKRPDGAHYALTVAYVQKHINAAAAAVAAANRTPHQINPKIAIPPLSTTTKAPPVPFKAIAPAITSHLQISPATTAHFQNAPTKPIQPHIATTFARIAPAIPPPSLSIAQTNIMGSLQQQLSGMVSNSPANFVTVSTAQTIHSGGRNQQPLVLQPAMIPESLLRSLTSAIAASKTPVTVNTMPTLASSVPTSPIVTTYVAPSKPAANPVIQPPTQTPTPSITSSQKPRHQPPSAIFNGTPLTRNDPLTTALVSQGVILRQMQKEMKQLWRQIGQLNKSVRQQRIFFSNMSRVLQTSSSAKRLKLSRKYRVPTFHSRKPSTPDVDEQSQNNGLPTSNGRDSVDSGRGQIEMLLDEEEPYGPSAKPVPSYSMDFQYISSASCSPVQNNPSHEDPHITTSVTDQTNSIVQNLECVQNTEISTDVLESKEIEITTDQNNISIAVIDQSSSEILPSKEIEISFNSDQCSVSNVVIEQPKIKSVQTNNSSVQPEIESLQTNEIEDQCDIDAVSIDVPNTETLGNVSESVSVENITVISDDESEGNLVVALKDESHIPDSMETENVTSVNIDLE